MRVPASFFLFLPLLSAASLETGVVARSDGATFFRNTIPQVARLRDGRLMCVFSAYAKGSADGRIVATFSSDGGRTWSAPRLLIDEPGMNDADPNILVDGDQVFVYATRVKIPNAIDKAWTIMVHSRDNGATWSQPQEVFIPRQYTPGKQHNALKLTDGTYAMGISWDLWAEKGMAARTEGEMVLASGLLKSRDGRTWTLHGHLTALVEKVTPGSINGLAEPSIVELAPGEILMILRSGGSRHWESRSTDYGVTWSEPRPSALIGHNTPTALWRLEEAPSELVAVWNNSPIHRFPLTAALSADGGRTFTRPKILANPIGYQVSYPGLTQAADRTIVAVWQQALPDGGRDIRWARFTRQWLLAHGE
ncbi:MAG: sialidase family protein [Bryobacterales bacterium]|nr:sialidase family protein [Bryobacterales bacterium]